MFENSTCFDIFCGSYLFSLNVGSDTYVSLTGNVDEEILNSLVMFFPPPPSLRRYIDSVSTTYLNDLVFAFVARLL